MSATLANPKTERKERFKKLVQLVATMPDDQRAEVAAKLGAVVNTTGHALSPFNCCLLYSQAHRPLTIVGGFKQWLAQGRCVAKGQHGYMIWVPIGRKRKAEDSEERVSFIAGTVFDISQTVPLEISPESV